MIADLFPDDAQDVSDEEWLHYATRHGYVGLTKDKRIRYQPSFQSANACVFALADGNLTLSEMVERFDAARDRIWNNASTGRREFWIVYGGGRVEPRYP